MIEINRINSSNLFFSQCEVSQSGYLLGLDRRYECDWLIKIRRSLVEGERRKLYYTLST